MLLAKLNLSSPEHSRRLPSQRRRQLLPKYEKNMAWSIIFNSHFADWVKREAERVIFDPGVYCITSRDFSPMQISAHGLHVSMVEVTAEMHGRTNITLKERANREPSELYTIHLPYRLKLKSVKEAKADSSGLKPMQVCGFHNNLVIFLALCKDHHLQFIVMDLYTCEFVGKYVIKWTWQPFLCECIISPDHTRFLIKPSMFYAEEQDNGNDYPYLKEIRVININNGLCKLERTIHDSNCSKYAMSFDPRYDHSRVALGNWNNDGKDDQGDIVCILDVRRQEPIVCSHNSVDAQATRNLVFSPDGSFLASLTYEPCFYQGVHNFPKILIYDSDTLDIVKVIQCRNTQCVPLYPAILFPSFSKCGTKMAVGYGRDIDIMGSIFGQEIAFVDVYQVPIPINLQYLCRVKIRRSIPKDKYLSTLPLPKPLISYLKFGPLLD